MGAMKTITVSYSHIVNSGYDMSRNIGSLPVNMAMPGDGSTTATSRRPTK
jgi:hypothetical protein